MALVAGLLLLDADLMLRLRLLKGEALGAIHVFAVAGDAARAHGAVSSRKKTNPFKKAMKHKKTQ